MTVEMHEPTDSGTQYAITRIPIFNQQRQLIAYEVSPPDLGALRDDKPDTQLCRMALGTALHAIGLDELLGDCRGLLPCTIEMIDDGEHCVLAPDRVTLLLRDIPSSGEVTKICQRAIDDGYTLAARTSDTPDSGQLPALSMLLTPQSSGFRPARSAKLVATDVQSQEDFTRAIQAGFQGAQGWFFCQPDQLSARSPGKLSPTCIRLISLVTARQFDAEAIEATIKGDLGLTHALLQQINSSARGVRSRVSSIRMAMNLLGERHMRAWGTIAAMRSTAPHKPAELVRIALLRGRFCELAASHVKIDADAGFLVGLLSVLDALLDLPMERAIGTLPIEDAMQDALLARRDSKLATLLELAKASERGAWASAQQIGHSLGISRRHASKFYFTAMQNSPRDYAA